MRILPSQSSGHEAERRVDLLVDDGEVEAVALGDRAPSSGRRRRRADRRPCGASRSRIASMSIDGAEVGDVGVEVVVRGASSARAAPASSGMRCTPASRRSSSALARASIQPRDVGVGRAAVRRVVLEAAVVGRVVRRRDHDAVGEPGRAAAVVGEDRVRDRRRRRVSSPSASIDLDAVRGEHLERGRRTPARDSACVSMPRNSGPSMPCCAAVAADRLRDREHVRLVEATARTTSRGGPRCRTRRAAPATAGSGRRCSTPSTSRRRRRGGRRNAACRRAG